MSVSYFVFYQGSADCPEEFLSYYRNHHVPILLTFPGIEAVRLHTGASWSDPKGVSAAGFFLVAQMIFPDTDTLDRALISPQRAAAREDFHRFPRFNGSVLHQAMRTEEALL